ncbi:MAG TPA: cyclic 2,3-diphosphoglycerate synthase [Myxococcota bacterium]|jgi:predicted GTPase|nr:cyclic 2,3-diphosphoglycerate synthase [Myxococcota bacterium]
MGADEELRRALPIDGGAPAGARPDPTPTLILGAAGRDFHCFNVVYRSDPSFRAVAFTAAQIPGIAHRRYPPGLSGPLYTDGIPIEDEAELEALCRRHDVRRVVFAYSDVTHAHVMHLASRALACGADFVLHGPAATMLRARRPVIAVSAVRTGCGKSQTARWIARRLADAGVRVVALRHPMPYGDLERQRVQRFASLADLRAADCTIEEREEYEPWVALGAVVFAGVDYAAILERAEAEADVLVWDGGNNDFPFLRPDLHVVLTDALRPDQLTTHHPGEAVLRMADVVVVNKVDAAADADVRRLVAAVRALRPTTPIVRTASPPRLDDPSAVRGRRVLVVEDGPTITHGGMPYGAGFVAATHAGAEIVDPRPSAAPALAAVYTANPHIGRVLPAMGYGAAQREALRVTIEASEADVVVAATPIDLASVLGLAKPVVRVRYELEEAERPGLGAIVDAFVASATRSEGAKSG